MRDERKNRGDRFDVSFFVYHSSGFTQVTRNRTMGGEQSIREQRWEGVTAKRTAGPIPDSPCLHASIRDAAQR